MALGRLGSISHGCMMQFRWCSEGSSRFLLGRSLSHVPHRYGAHRCFVSSSIQLTPGKDTEATGGAYPDWRFLNVIRQRAPRLWGTFDFYYTNMKRERELQEKVRNQERKRQQQAELADLDEQLKQLQDEHSRMNDELSRSLQIQPSRNLRTAYEEWHAAHEKLRRNIDTIQERLVDLRSARHQMVERHLLDDKQYEELLLASQPREQLDLLLRSIGPSYYLFFACLGVLGWLINQYYNYRDRKKILSRLTAATSLSQSLPSAIDSLSQCHARITELQTGIQQLLQTEAEARETIATDKSSLESALALLPALQQAVAALRAELTIVEAQLLNARTLLPGHHQVFGYTIPSEWMQMGIWLCLFVLVFLTRR